MTYYSCKLILNERMSSGNTHLPFQELLSILNPIVVKMITNLSVLDVSQSNIPEHIQTDMEPANVEKQGSDLLHEVVKNLLKLDQDHCLMSDLHSLFEESSKKMENILNLPQECSCWCFGDFEYSFQPDGKVMRFMAVLDIATLQPVTQMTSFVYKSDISYEEQAMMLFDYACFHPVRKHSRRPYYVRLFNTPEARGVVLDVTKFGVNFVNFETSVEITLNMLTQENHVWFRRCFNCGLRGTPDMFIPCSQCKAVMYCDQECQMESWKTRHKTWCKKFRTYMKMEDQLANLPFTFSPVSTSQNFTRQKFTKFLQENDIYNKGLWRREYPSSSSVDADSIFGELLSLHSPYALPLESAVLESVPFDKYPPSLDRRLQDWADYYSYRGFWLDSPIAGLLHYPLTLYWIIVYWLPHHYMAVFENMKVSHSLQVHIIGAEKEAEMFEPFLECARLLAPVDLHIHLFGNELSKNVNNKCQNKENLTFHVHCSLYHECTLSDLPSPDLVVGFNAGLSAYSTFIETIKLLMENKTPLYCTDYCYYSIVHSQKALSISNIGEMLVPVINPFRSPFRLVAEEMNFPRYSNAFIYCVKPWKPNRKYDADR